MSPIGHDQRHGMRCLPPLSHCHRCESGEARWTLSTRRRLQVDGNVRIVSVILLTKDYQRQNKKGQGAQELHSLQRFALAEWATS
uniref:Uncharacterized protein n=1 Tax=Manihot esculenta TaxID=3983 RepID=A0A2C9WHU1_MANES